MADPSRLKESSADYEGTKIDCIEITDSPYGFCSAVTEELVIMANHIDSVKETIDLLASVKFALSQSQTFRKTLSNLSAVSDEISFVDIPNTLLLFKAMPVGVLAENLLAPFEAVTWVKHYFNDGVSTEGYLLLK